MFSTQFNFISARCSFFSVKLPPIKFDKRENWKLDGATMRNVAECKSSRGDASKYERPKVARMLQIAEQRGWATEEGRGQGKEYKHSTPPTLVSMATTTRETSVNAVPSLPILKTVQLVPYALCTMWETNDMDDMRNISEVTH